MRRFDYSFLKSEVPGDIVNITSIIADLKAKEEIRKISNEKTFESLRKKAIVESVKGSNAIEGIVTTDDRIRDIIDGAKPITHDELEISGYRDVLKLIHQEHTNLDLNEANILMFHKMMIAEISPDEAGHYKKRDNLIMEYGTDGSRRVRFRPIAATDTKEAMEQLLLAYYEARQDAGIPKLLLIPCVIVDFLSIHPFLDGNGRISRLLTILLLYMNGYDIGRYISFEGQVNEYKEAYYTALEQSSYQWHENRNDYMPFVVNFLQILYRCFRNLDDQFMELSLKKAKKSERVEAIVMSALVPISKTAIAEKVPDVSVKTVEVVLNKLLKAKKIVKIGTYKDARYMKK